MESNIFYGDFMVKLLWRLPAILIFVQNINHSISLLLNTIC